MFLCHYLAFKYCPTSALLILVIESTSIRTSLYLCFTVAIISIIGTVDILGFGLYSGGSLITHTKSSLLVLKFKGNSFYSMGSCNKVFFFALWLSCCLYHSLSISFFSFESGSLLCCTHCNCYFRCISIPFHLHSVGGITSSSAVAVSHFNLPLVLYSIGEAYLVPFCCYCFVFFCHALSVRLELSFHINGKLV